MPMTTHELLSMFGGVEEDQRYTRLLDLFADDAVYYDPFFGAQVGKPAIQAFMERMEVLVPKSGARFDAWETTAEQDCGFAQWLMVAPNAEGIEVPVPGESLYRVRDGLVVGVVDYIDPVAYNRLRGPAARDGDLITGMGSLPTAGTPAGPVAAEMHAHVGALTRAGRWPGRAELVDHAGETAVGWAQWLFHGEHGDFAGWSLRSPDGHIRDFFDAVTAHQLALAAGAVAR